MFNIINLILFIISTILLLFIIKKEKILNSVIKNYNNSLISIGIDIYNNENDNSKLNLFSLFKSMYFFYITQFIMSIIILLFKESLTNFIIINFILMFILTYYNFIIHLQYLNGSIKRKIQLTEEINQFIEKYNKNNKGK